MTEGSWFDFWLGKGGFFFFLLQTIQTGSGVHRGCGMLQRDVHVTTVVLFHDVNKDTFTVSGNTTELTLVQLLIGHSVSGFHCSSNCFLQM